MCMLQYPGGRPPELPWEASVDLRSEGKNLEKQGCATNEGAVAAPQGVRVDMEPEEEMGDNYPELFGATDFEDEVWDK